MKATGKDFYREIWKNPGRFFSILFIVLLGVAFFSGIRSASPDMGITGDAYFDSEELMDVRLISTYGITEEDVETFLEQDYVDAAEGAYSADFLSKIEDKQEVLHVFSVPEKLNHVTPIEGRLPEKVGECLIDSSLNFQLGEEIVLTSGTGDAIEDMLNHTKYTVVGIGSSPCYISYGRGNSTIGTGNVNGFMVITKDNFESEVFTEAYLQLKGAKALQSFSQEYDALTEEAMTKLETLTEFCGERRKDSLVADAREELDKAQKDYDEGKESAEKELADAKKEIEDGKAELSDAQKELADGERKLRQARDEIAAKEVELKDAKAQYELALAQMQLLPEVPPEVAEQLEMARVTIEQGEAALEAGKAELTAQERKLRDGKKTYDENVIKLEDAEKEYEKAKEDVEEELADAEQKLNDAREEVEDISLPEWYIDDREALPDYKGLGDNAERLKGIGRVFPILFFLVAALISLTNMTRMVEEQRSAIGTMKALGYRRWKIAEKYLGYALLASVLGSVIGVLFGEKVLPYIIIYAYGILYHHINIILTPYNWYYGIVASGIAIGCIFFATLAACFSELTATPAILMRPPTPKQGKRVILERIPFLWKRLNFTWKSTVRNLLRYKKRFFMTIFGIGGCMALLLLGFGLRDSIYDVTGQQYRELQLYHGISYLKDDLKKKEVRGLTEYFETEDKIKEFIPVEMEKVTLKAGDRQQSAYLCVPESTENLNTFLVFRNRKTKETYQLSDNGVILSEKTAKMLKIKPGDHFELRDKKGKKREFVLENICENYMGHYLYMTPAYYESVYGKAPEYNCMFFKTLPDSTKEEKEEVGRRIMERDEILSVIYTSDTQDRLDDMLKSLNLVIVVLIVSAGMLSFVVLYSLNDINITERQRELATLKVLGFFNMEVAAYVYRENILLTFIGALVGVALGKGLHQFVVQTVEVDEAMFGRIINFESFVYSLALTVLFSLFVNAVMYFKLRKIDMVESLKSVE